MVADVVRMDDASLAVMNELRDFMFQRIYLGPEQRRQLGEAIEVIRRLVDHHLLHPEAAARPRIGTPRRTWSPRSPTTWRA